MFFIDRQQKFPEEFRIDDSGWDYEIILEAVNRESDDAANMQRELKYLESKVKEMEQELATHDEGSLDIDHVKEIILRVWRVNNRAEFYRANNNMRRAENMVRDNEDFEENEINFITKSMNDSLKPIKYIANQSKAVLKYLEENGFVIKDHTGSKYYDGMALHVLVFETDENIKESTITETIKPSIFYKDKLIMNGEVVVTSPPHSENN